MKKFLVKVVLYTLLPVVLFLFTSVVLSLSNKDIAKNYKLNKDIENIIIGDSRTQIFQDKKIKKTKNIALGSESYYYSYYKLKYIINNNRQIKTVFLGSSYHSFSDYFDQYIYESDVISNYFYILPLLDQLSLFFNPETNLCKLIKNSVIKGFNNIFSIEKSYIGKSYIHNTNKEVSEKSIKDRINFVYLNKSKVREFSKLNKDYFNKIVNLCKDENINLILLKTPTHSLHNALIPEKFKIEYREIVTINGLKVISFDGLLNDCMFLPDGDHINKIGAEILTAKLAKYINLIQ